MTKDDLSADIKELETEKTNLQNIETFEDEEHKQKVENEIERIENQIDYLYEQFDFIYED
jgi:hypothetical protein